MLPLTWMTLANLSLMTSSLYLLMTENISLMMELNLSKMENVNLPISINLDTISLGYVSCVTIVSMSIMLFSTYYMKGSENFRQFNYLLLLFILSMALLVTSENFIMTLIGWDGLGITSFCLVIFYNSPNSLSSGLLTMLMNRLGDSLLMTSMIMMYQSSNFSINHMQKINTMYLILLMTGAITKSAQIPFSSWLPAAMAAPTPVSSLVHSSTLVTAGSFLIIRYNFMFSKNNLTFSMICMLSMFIAGMSACYESDLKKLIAMSTLSQLSLMIYLSSISLWKLSLIHMMLHAMFKSMMFLSAGSLMASSMGNQDLRSSYKSNTMKFSWILMTSSCLSLAGFPFSLGFYSKDLMLANIPSTSSTITSLLFTLNCLLTVIYSMRFMMIPMITKSTTTATTSEKNSMTFLISFIPSWMISTLTGQFIYHTLSTNVPITSMTNLLTGVVLITMSIPITKKISANNHPKKSMSPWTGIFWLSSSWMSSTTKNFNSWTFERAWLETMDKIPTITNMTKFLQVEKITNPVSFIILMIPSSIMIL